VLVFISLRMSQYVLMYVMGHVCIGYIYISCVYVHTGYIYMGYVYILCVNVIVCAYVCQYLCVSGCYILSDIMIDIHQRILTSIHVHIYEYLCKASMQMHDMHTFYLPMCT